MAAGDIVVVTTRACAVNDERAHRFDLSASSACSFSLVFHMDKEELREGGGGAYGGEGSNGRHGVGGSGDRIG